MTSVPAGHRRIATFFLGLFLSLLAMVTLHGLSHQAERVPCTTTVQCDSPAQGDQAVSTAHVAKAECALCQFVHTPFLGLTSALTLVVLLLSLCEFLARVCSGSQRFARLSPQLRAPPTLA